MIIKISLAFLLFLVSSDKKKPKLLIIGDSISIGYTPFVQKYFKGKAEIEHNENNAQHTGNGLKKIKDWIGNEEWDVIQFNFGLWDLCYRHPDSKVQGNRDKINGSITYSISEYTANLDAIVTYLKQNTKAKLIFVTTTYVPINEAGRFEIDAVKYNEAAKAVMLKHSVLVNDIYTKSVQIHKEFGNGLDDVHYTKKGYEMIGDLINDFLKNEFGW